MKKENLKETGENKLYVFNIIHLIIDNLTENFVLRSQQKTTGILKRHIFRTCHPLCM